MGRMRPASIALLGLLSLLPGCGGNDSTGPGHQGFSLRADSPVAAGRVQLHATLDGQPITDVDYIVEGGPEHGRVTADGVFHNPVPLPAPPTSRVTARTRTEPPLEDSILLSLEDCGWNPGQIPCGLQGHRDDGARVRLDQYAGTMILLSFGATWCGPCRVAAGTSEALNTRLKNAFPVPFTQIEVLLDDPPVAPHFWSDTYGLTFPVLAMDSDDKAYSGPLGIHAIPTFIIITPDFRVRRRYAGAWPNENVVAEVQAAWAEYQADR